MTRKLSIIVPVYNESSYVIRSLENIVNVTIPGWTKEIIVVNDGSTDNTLELLHDFNRENTKITILTTPKNTGKGSALKKGIHQATGEIVIVQDADLEYDPDDYLAILTEYDKRKANVIYGSRILGAKIYHNFNANILFLWGGITLTGMTNGMFGTNLTDQPTCYKSWKGNLSKKLLDYCKSDGFEFEVEMTAFFSKSQTIIEVPIHYYPRSVNHGKKIQLKDFIKSIVMIFYCRFRK